MKTKPSHGGARANSGRKSIDPAQKKKQLFIFVEQSKIDALGGEEKTKELLYETIDKEIEQLLASQWNDFGEFIGDKEKANALHLLLNPKK